MPETILFTVEGVDTLRAKLKALGADMQKEMMTAAEKGMLVLEAEIKRKAPVRTGNLRDSYNTEVARAAGEVIAITGTNVEYGPTMEYGPRPHVRPALDQTRGDIQAVVLNELKKAINRRV